MNFGDLCFLNEMHSIMVCNLFGFIVRHNDFPLLSHAKVENSEEKKIKKLNHTKTGILFPKLELE